jgi:hypothetical protein
LSLGHLLAEDFLDFLRGPLLVANIDVVGVCRVLNFLGYLELHKAIAVLQGDKVLATRVLIRLLPVPLPFCIRNLGSMRSLWGSATGIVEPTNALFVRWVLHSFGIDVQKRKVLVVPLLGSRPEGGKVF